MESVMTNLLKDVKIPRMIKVKQNFRADKIEPEQIPSVINDLLIAEKFKEKIKPGMRVCITCGSRGIKNLEVIIKSLVDYCKQKKSFPFIVPAMGSHGGATSQGQREVLKSLNITEETIGCPILSSMQTVLIGSTEEGHLVYIDKNAYEADAIIVFGRIKPHTAFRGPYESGLMKMMTIGLGKQKGAETCHESGFKNMHKLVPMFGKVIIKNAQIAFGVATIENAFEETYKLIALTPDEIITEEPKLLKIAFEQMPKIFFDSCDALIVDEFGKNISGEGMDPNITSTFGTPYASGGINVQKVGVLRLSEETHGNAHGIGVADAISKKLYEQIDLEITYPNSITSTVLLHSRIPMITHSDKELFQLCIKTCNEIDKDNPKLIRIHNTVDLEYLYISEAMLEEAKKNPNITIIGELGEIKFDNQNNVILSN